MKKIRIIYTIPNFDTCGSGVALMKLIIGLDKSKFEPILICNHDRGTRFQMVKDSGIKYYLFDYLAHLTPRIKLFFGVCKTAFFFLKLRPNIVFSYHYGSNFSEALAARLIGAKFIFVKKNMSWEGPSYNQWKLKTFLSHSITVQNKDMMNYFFSGNEKAELISIGVDTNEYFPRKKNIELLNSLNIELNKKIILCVANIIPKKGVDYLLHAFKKLSVDSSLKLLIVGDYNSDYGFSILQLMRDLQIEDSVIFTGKRFDVEQFYSIADLFILPSTGNEGAPIVIQEAMASGVVVITSDTPGNRDQLSEFPNQLIEPANAGDIYRALNEFMKISFDERELIIKKQIEVLEEKYSLQREILLHERLYHRLLNNKK